MKHGFWLSALLIVLVLFAFAAPAAFASGPVAQTPESGIDPDAIYIVRLRLPSLAAYEGGVAGLAATSPQVTGARKLDATSAVSQVYLDYLSGQHDAFQAALEQRLGRKVAFVADYRYAYNGVAVMLSESEAARVKVMPEVLQVQRNFVRYPLTDHGPEWIGAPALWGAPSSCAPGGFCGEGIIIGVIDTGINHDHPSFADIGGDGYNHTNPFGAGNYKGSCVSQPSLCNDKLIGMYAYLLTGGPEDDEGHGSHTASTAGGNFINNVSLVAPTITFPGLNLSGVAPHANIISYDVCSDGCYLFNLVSAIDQAVADGVDVINYSIGGASASPWSNSDAQAMLDARDAGIFVAVSAGNSGPNAATIGSPADAPWVTAVGAATHDRAFLNSLTDMTTNQSTTLPAIEGRSITSGYGPAPIVYAGDAPYNNPLCNPFPANTFSGQIVVCDRGTIGRIEKGQNVDNAGGGGMILANDAASAYGLSADPHALPAVHISFAAGVTLKNWLHNGNTGHTGRITGTTMAVDSSFADEIASFSSRGPNPATSKVLKPDIAGPGVDIVAAVNTVGNPNPAPEIDSYSGTSMSSPHIAGAAALILDAHPTWTPAEVQSALMSTAVTADVVLDDATTPANPFDRGAGRVDLSQATLAGFVLNETRANYDNADPGSGGNPASLNTASLAQNTCNGSCSWTRTLKSTRAGTWQIAGAHSPDVAVTASPSTVTFTGAGQTQVVTFTAYVYGLASGAWGFGQANFDDSSESSPDAHFPVAVSGTCTPAAGPTVEIGESGSNAQLSWNSVAGATSYEVWRSTNPYFTPNDSGSTLLTTTNSTNYTDTGVIASGQPNYYYKVIARNNCGGNSSATANHTADFLFDLTPGS